jgi:hypothetical protein
MPRSIMGPDRALVVTGGHPRSCAAPLRRLARGTVKFPDVRPLSRWDAASMPARSVTDACRREPARTPGSSLVALAPVAIEAGA